MGRNLGRKSEVLAPSGFEPLSPAPKASMLGHYTTGLPQWVTGPRYLIVEPARSTRPLAFLTWIDFYIVKSPSANWKHHPGPSPDSQVLGPSSGGGNGSYPSRGTGLYPCGQLHRSAKDEDPCHLGPGQRHS